MYRKNTQCLQSALKATCTWVSNNAQRGETLRNPTRKRVLFVCVEKVEDAPHWGLFSFPEEALSHQFRLSAKEFPSSAPLWKSLEWKYIYIYKKKQQQTNKHLFARSGGQLLVWLSHRAWTSIKTRLVIIVNTGIKLQKYIHCGHSGRSLWGSDTHTLHVCVGLDIHSAMHSSLKFMSLLWSGYHLITGVCGCVCVCERNGFTGDGGFDSVSHHVLVVYRPLAASVGLQLIVWVPLRNDGSVRVGVTLEGPPPHRFTPSQRRRRRRCGFRRGGGASELVVPWLGGGAMSGGGGGAGGGAERGELDGAASQAAVSQTGLWAPPMEGERDEESARELTWGAKRGN